MSFDLTDSILDRIGKLLRLAGDKGATEAEAATALEKAHEILAAHNLTLEMVDQRRQGKEAESLVGHSIITVSKWDVSLFNILANHNYCKILRYKYRITLIGRPVNTEVTRVTYQWVKEQVEKMWMNTWAKDPRRLEGMNWRSHKSAFYKGITSRLYSRLQQQKKAEAPVVTTMAMIRVDENQQYMERIGYRKGTKRYDKRVVDEEAFYAGYRQGDNVTLTKTRELGSGSL